MKANVEFFGGRLKSKTDFPVLKLSGVKATNVTNTSVELRVVSFSSFCKSSAQERVSLSQLPDKYSSYPRIQVN